jgi:hypothetical protein
MFVMQIGDILIPSYIAPERNDACVVLQRQQRYRSSLEGN